MTIAKVTLLKETKWKGCYLLSFIQVSISFLIIYIYQIVMISLCSHLKQAMYECSINTREV